MWHIGSYAVFVRDNSAIGSISEAQNKTIIVQDGDLAHDYIIENNITDDIIWDIVESEILDEESKKIRIWIKEWINLTKDWKINFYLSVKNINTWDKFDIKQINYIPVTVLPNDDNVV